MTDDVELTETVPERIAAVRVNVVPGQVGQVWRSALDQVCAFLREHADLHPGHNLFLYRHPTQPGDLMEVDFGVQVAQDFAPHGKVRSVATPGGRVARTLYTGPVEGISAAHAALVDGCAAKGLTIGAQS